MRLHNDWKDYIGGAISQAQIDESYAFGYMRGRLKIYIREKDEGYQGHIRFEGSRCIFNWHIPQDLYEIAKDLWNYVSRDAGKIIYGEIESHFNEALSTVQMSDKTSDTVCVYKFPEWESMIPNMRPQIRIDQTRLSNRGFGDWVWNLEDRLREASENMRADLWIWDRYWTSVTTNTYGDYNFPTLTSSSMATDNIHYVTQQEYDTMRERGELQSNTIYCVLSN